VEKAMVSIRQSGEFTIEKLTQTQNIVYAMALFSVKEATGAKRRHYNKLKKSLAGYGQKAPPNQLIDQHLKQSLQILMNGQDVYVRIATRWRSIAHSSASLRRYLLIRLLLKT
jgi:hypothetical protein